MKNIHVLPTDKPSKLFIDIDDNKLKITIPIGGEHMMNQNIYITNSEEIKEGDWFITNNNEIFKCIKNKEEQCFYSLNASILTKFCKKIILTTDQDLIKDDIQAIDDEFLEWFVKNPSCEYVEVKTRYVHYYKTGETFISLSKTPEFSSRNMQCIKIEPRYEIIIPKEEPKQETHICKYCKAETWQSDDECYAKPKQEKLTYTESAKKEERISNSIMMKRKQKTVEEDDLKIPSKFCIPHKHYISDDDKICYETGYKDGIKLMQERMYSEEEVRRAFQDGQDNMNHSEMYGWSSKLTEQEWFNQFKKTK